MVAICTLVAEIHIFLISPITSQLYDVHTPIDVFCAVSITDITQTGDEC